MIKNVLTNIGGVGGYGLVSLCLFFGFFVGMLWWALRLKKSYLNAMGGLPLDSDSRPDSDHLLNSKNLLEKPVLGSTGYQPVPSGNLPDGTGAVSMNDLGTNFIVTPAAIPVGKLPTGAGKLPAPPIF